MHPTHSGRCLKGPVNVQCCPPYSLSGVWAAMCCVTKPLMPLCPVQLRAANAWSPHTAEPLGRALYLNNAIDYFALPPICTMLMFYFSLPIFAWRTGAVEMCGCTVTVKRTVTPCGRWTRKMQDAHT